MRSGSTGIAISLPKQKHLSYLLNFSTHDGTETYDLNKIIFLKNIYSILIDANSFLKHLSSVKLGQDINENASSSQFDDRTEESSALQYFQVKI